MSSGLAASHATAAATGKPSPHLRDFIRTEVGRVLNALVAAKRPAALVLERLDF